jgi:hypothetical protein
MNGDHRTTDPGAGVSVFRYAGGTSRYGTTKVSYFFLWSEMVGDGRRTEDGRRKMNSCPNFGILGWIHQKCLPWFDFDTNSECLRRSFHEVSRIQRQRQLEPRTTRNTRTRQAASPVIRSPQSLGLSASSSGCQSWRANGRDESLPARPSRPGGMANGSRAGNRRANHPPRSARQAGEG